MLGHGKLRMGYIIEITEKSDRKLVELSGFEPRAFRDAHFRIRGNLLQIDGLGTEPVYALSLNGPETKRDCCRRTSKALSTERKIASVRQGQIPEGFSTLPGSATRSIPSR